MKMIPELKPYLRVLLAILCLSHVLRATSVVPQEFDCPLCGKTSIHNQLASYSNFDGPPARDRTFEPIFSEAMICPHDLFAAWDFERTKLKDEEKQQLAKLLEKPVVDLTEKEKAIVGPHLTDLKQYDWWPLLWLRTCDQRRDPGAQNAEMIAMQLYFNGDLKSPEVWVRELSHHYRDQAIEILANTTSPQRRFLRAELLRQSGKSSEAAPIFKQLTELLGKMPEGPEDEDERLERDGFRNLCKEGLLLIEAENSSAERVAGWLLTSKPEEEATLSPKWSRHRIALQHLVERSARGDKEANEVLWKWVAKRAERLLFMEETLENTPGAPRLRELRQAGGQWAKWFDELITKKDSDSIPNNIGPESPSYHEVAWQKKVLLPLVRSADPADKIPDTDFEQDELAFGLASLLGKELPESDSIAVSKTIIRLLKQLPEPKKNPDYSYGYAVTSLAEHAPRFPALQQETGGKWKSVWWQLLADYAVGKPGLSPALAAHPLATISFRDDGKAFEPLLWELFALRKDPVWKEKVVAYLKSAEWLSDKPVEYAVALDHADLNDILDQMILRREEGKTGTSQWFTGCYVIGEARKERMMNALPVR